MLTKKEKQLLRVAVAILTNVIVRDNKKKWVSIDKLIREHPERYSEEFITETGYPKEEIERLLKIRKERLKTQGAETSVLAHQD